jgi:hypothetical protein
MLTHCCSLVNTEVNNLLTNIRVKPRNSMLTHCCSLVNTQVNISLTNLRVRQGLNNGQ